MDRGRKSGCGRAGNFWDAYYLALQTGLAENEPTGRWTIPELLDREREQYYAALRAADLEAARSEEPIPLRELESLLINCYLDQSENPDPHS